jgi:molybdopterin-binding protein
MATIAELTNVKKVFGNKTVLDSINLQINEGEILALLGPNGSGKTTLLKILAFIDDPTSGLIRFQGEVVTPKNTEEMRMESTLVFQKTALFDTSVFNNIAYGLKIRKIPKNLHAKEVRKMLKLVKLEGFENRSAKKLSGGEQQRVALARALVLNTKLLLLDEPTSNLDPKNASIIEEIIAVANRELQTTIVMATHNMFQAETLPDRIALIHDGKIAEVGAPQDIFGAISKNLASFAAVNNSFMGTAADSGVGTTLVDIGNGIQVEVTTQRSGEVSIFVSPQDIILLKKPVASSARNVFKGKITTITDSGSLVRLTVDVGNPFTVQITKRSFSEMELNLNTEVFIAFKASSVHVL